MPKKRPIFGNLANPRESWAFFYFWGFLYGVRVYKKRLWYRKSPAKWKKYALFAFQIWGHFKTKYPPHWKKTHRTPQCAQKMTKTLPNTPLGWTSLILYVLPTFQVVWIPIRWLKRFFGPNYPQKPLIRSWADGTEMSKKQGQTLSGCAILIQI